MHEPISILVVDDLASQRLTIEAALAELGERVVCVSSGREALKFLLDHDAAVVLLDVNMPEMDGFETAELIRRRPRNVSTPIIFLTADNDEMHIARGYALGAVDYVICPFLPEVLRTKVKVFVTLSRAREQIRAEADQRVAFLREQAARTAAEEQSRRMRLLSEVGAVLALALDGGAVERELLRTLIPVLGDQAGLILEGSGDGGEPTVWLEADGAPPSEASDLSHLPEALRRVLASGASETLRCGRERTPRGTVLPLLMHGRPYGAIAVARYDGPFGEAEQALAGLVAGRTAIALENRRLFRELQERDRKKDEFLAMLSHELRNPLGAITAAARVLDLLESPDERATLARQVITRQSLHLARLVDDLLEVSRVTSGRITLNRQPVDLCDVIERTLEALRAAGRLDRHRLEIHTAPASVVADAARMEQVLANLVVNAVKYTDPGGTIAITCGSDAERAFLQVADNGSGISPELLPNLFEVFVQGGQNVDRAQGGLGIGLTLVRKLVELQGGAVRAASDGPGRGSTFTIELPLHATPATSDSAEPAPEARRGPLRVLVVDDNDDARHMLRAYLELRGHTVHEAASGPEAVAAAEKHSSELDVALVDIGLPGFDGLEVARRLRARPETRRLLLVALTGYGQAQDRERTQAVGYDAHLVKPVTARRLDEVLGLPSPRSTGAGIGTS